MSVHPVQKRDVQHQVVLSTTDKKQFKAVEITENTSHWYINNHWYIVRNDKNYEFTGPWWMKYFYSLVYVPKKTFAEPGYSEELKEAENTKKKITIIVAIGSVFILCYASTFINQGSFISVHSFAKRFLLCKMIAN